MGTPRPMQMNLPVPDRRRPDPIAMARLLADQAFSRAAGAPLVPGNEVRLLVDGRENYPAWMDAIKSARDHIHFESYIIHEDEVGHRFADALIRKAREGVRVRLLYDWLGGIGKASRGFWSRLRAGGVEVLCFNPPRLDSPLGWVFRDHRKTMVVDGEVGFVSGLCVGQMWLGDPGRGVEAWRDTGVEVRGPAVADLAWAFRHVWERAGGSISDEEMQGVRDLPEAGNVALRVIATDPSDMDVYRLDQLVAVLARERLWLTDAYFAAVSSYVQALQSAARDGVDVRLLVPGTSDVSLVKFISRASYRPLLEAGVRVFEWNGPMLHAKTAVADGRWARVGSTNLNLASWISNWEMDLAVEDKALAREMEALYESDLENATEIVLDRGQVHPAKPVPPGARHPRSDRRKTGRARRAAAGAIGVGSAVGAAFTNRRELGPAEAKVMAAAAVVVLFFSLLFLLVPRLLTIPLAVVGVWTGATLLVRAQRLRNRARRSPRRSASVRPYPAERRAD
jgi:cardiolipin synthase A/B